MEGQTNNMETNTPTTPNTPNIPNNPNVPAENGSSTGPIIGTIVIVVIIVLAAFYFWGERTNVDNTVQDIKMQDKSDETSSIEADLQSTDIDSVDAELNAS